MYHPTQATVEVQECNVIPQHRTSIQQSAAHQDSFQSQVVDSNEKVKDTEGFLSPTSNKGNRTANRPIYEDNTPVSDNATTVKHLPETCHKDRLPSDASDNDDQGEGYLQLTLKLQKALNKISSSGNKLNQTLSSSRNLILRFQQCELRKRRAMDQKKQENEATKFREVKDRPTINKNSDKMARDMGHKPIVERLDQLLHDKQEKFKQYSEIKKKQEEEEEALFWQEYRQHAKRPDNPRTSQEYYSQMVRWKERRAEQLAQKMTQQQAKQLQTLTFRPTLNPKSEKLVAYQFRAPISERGLIQKQSQLNKTTTIPSKKRRQF